MKKDDIPVRKKTVDDKTKSREKESPALKKAQDKVRRHIEDEKQKSTPESVNPGPPLSPEES